MLAPAEARAFYQGSFYDFCEDVVGYEDMYEPLHRRICEFVTDWSSGKRIKLLLIPRKHLKSSICSIALPMWEWMRDPETLVLMAQGVYGLGLRYLAELKAVMEDRAKVLHALAPDVFFANPEKESKRWKNIEIDVRRKTTKVPSFTVTGEKAGKTGLHYDLIIPDDLVHEKNVKTEESRQQTKTFFHNLMPHRKPDGRMLVVGTRWHPDDLYAYMLDPDFTLYDQVESLILDCGWPGEPIFPRSKSGRAGFTRESLQQEKNSMPEYEFSCHYMNNPMPEGIKRFGKEHIHRFEAEDNGSPPIDGGLLYFTAVDPNRSEKTKHDPCVVLTVARDWRGWHWVVDVSRGHPSGPELIEWIRAHVLRWAPERVIIEAQGFQNQLENWCRKDMAETGVFYLCQMAERGPTKKTERVTKMEPMIRSGGLWISSDPRFDFLIDELVNYEAGWKNDDGADALADVYQYGWNPPHGKDSPLSGSALAAEQDWGIGMRSGVQRVMGSGVRRVQAW